MVRKAMAQITGSFHSTYMMFLIIRIPTRTRAPTVQVELTEEKSPQRSREIRNRTPIVTDMSPVRPPEMMPVTVSDRMVVVVDPTAAPASVPPASH